MTLASRLSTSFLAALAVILVGFSTALHVVQSVSLNRSIDDRLEGAFATLAALVEDEPDGLDWEREGRQIELGRETGHDHVRWLILDETGREVDRSRNLGDQDVLLGSGGRQLDAKRHPWRVAQRRLTSTHPRNGSGQAGRSLSLTLAVGLPLEPVERPLRGLAFSLVFISLGIWGLTALIGRRLCKTALAPLTRMASDARSLDADEPGRRLPVAETGDELRDLAVAFNGLLDRWREALERQSRFAGDASHQLRTPLTALIGQVDVALRRDRPAADYREALSRVRDQADRLRKIIEALLFLARADSEAGLPALETFDLSDWAEAQLRRRADEGREGPTHLVDRSDEPVLIPSHPELLAEVLDNLIDNATLHGRGSRPTELKVSTRGEWAILTVEDHGPGMVPSELARVFEPFYRSSGARKASPRGVGLGLAVARRIVRTLGGRLEAESHIGHGSRFRVELPRVSEPSDAWCLGPEAEPLAPTPSPCS